MRLNVNPNRSRYSGIVRKIVDVVPKERIIVLVDTSEEEELIEKAYDLGALKYINYNSGKKEIRDILKDIKEEI